jgi:hypothetical protein
MLVCRCSEVVYQCLAIIHNLVPKNCAYQENSSLKASTVFSASHSRSRGLLRWRWPWQGCAVVNPTQIFSRKSDLSAASRLRLPTDAPSAGTRNQHTQYIFHTPYQCSRLRMSASISGFGMQGAGRYMYIKSFSMFNMSTPPYNLAYSILP